MLEEASGFPGSVHSTTQVGLAASPVGLEAQQGGLVLSTVAGPAVESARSRPEVQSQPSPLAMEEAHHDASTSLQGSVSAHADPFLSVVLAAKPSMAMAAPGESALPPPDSVPDATLGVEAVSAPLVCPEQHLAASSTPLSQVFSPVSALPTASAVVEVAEIGGPFPDEVVPVDEMAASPPAPSTAVFAAAVEEASAPPPTLITFSRRAKKAIPPALLPPPAPQQPPLQTPRRSVRQALQATHGAPTFSRCQSVLATVPAAPAPTVCTIQQYNELFEKELSQDQMLALADLFGICLPPPASVVVISPLKAA